MRILSTLRWIAIVAAVPAAAAIVAAQTTDVGAARRSIAAAAAARFGVGAEVDVRLTADVPATWHDQLETASLDPAARLGAPVWVTFAGSPGHSLRISADVRVTVDHVRTTHPVLAGAVLSAADVSDVREAVTGLPFRRLPIAAEVVGARVLRSLAAGDIIQSGFIVLPLVVHAGEPVTAIARIGGVEVSAQFVAAENGRTGDLIRVVNPETKRTVRARVVTSGTVEVLNER
jgi:flagella basal body P-ring formation protein FlgA